MLVLYFPSLPVSVIIAYAGCEHSVVAPAFLNGSWLGKAAFYRTFTIKGSWGPLLSFFHTATPFPAAYIEPLGKFSLLEQKIQDYLLEEH